MIYLYDTNGFYIGDADPQRCPVTKKPLIPSNATKIAPPDLSRGQRAQFFNGQWQIVNVSKPIAEKGYRYNWDGTEWKVISVERPYVEKDVNLIWENEEWVKVTRDPDEIAAEQLRTKEEQIIQAKIRQIAIDALIANGELSSDYIDPTTLKTEV